MMEKPEMTLHHIQLGRWLQSPFHREANTQKFKKNDGETANQLMKAMAVAVSKLGQWFSAHKFMSLPIKTVMPAHAQAAANVSEDVICIKEET